MDKLIPIIYRELRRIARLYLHKENRPHTLQATALANEAYLKLADDEALAFDDRRHFFAVAGRQIRRILVDHARHKYAQKRGGRIRAISFDECAHLELTDNPLLIELDDALNELGALDPRQADVVILRFFGGLSHDEVAVALNVSSMTVRRDWSMAKAWLSRELDNKSE